MKNRSGSFAWIGLFVLFVGPLFVSAQQNGRFALLKSQGLDLFQRGRYAEAAGKLEEIWEQNQSDPKVAEYLGMAYIYGERDVAKAKPVIAKAVELGGQASFLVQHSHERLSVFNGSTMNQYCTGRMLISPGKMEFAADSGDHSVTFTSANLKELRLAGGGAGRIEIKGAGKTYLFRVKSETRDEVVLLSELAEHNLKR